jgi:uncharacterized protein with LGFP repeats
MRRRMRRTALLTAMGAAVAAVLTLGMTAASADPYPSPDGGTRQVVGAILDDYRAVGGPSGPLGLPLTDELGTPAVFGRYNLFQHGAIYWTPATGAHEVRGAIWEHWGALGWENSFLGFPTTNELGTPAKYGRFNLFQRASMYWSPASGAHSIGGAIRDRWASLGWENSSLGFPVTDEFAIPGGRAQDFQCGSIRWSPAGGTVVVGCGTATPPVANPGDTKNCSDFATQLQAQAWFDRYYPLYGDVARLDDDNDRKACESLP